MSGGESIRSDADQPWPVRAIVGFGRFYARAFHRLDVLSPCQLPESGAAILVCNHTSGLDPVLVQSACPRLAIWMMAKEYYEIAALKWGFEMIETIPVERSGRDLSSTRSALRALSAGRVLGIFPEGRIAKDRTLLPFHTGVAMMARRAKVPVFPAYLTGSQHGCEMARAFAQSHRAILAFGPEIALSFDGADDELERGTAQIRLAVEALQTSAASMK